MALSLLGDFKIDAKISEPGLMSPYENVVVTVERRHLDAFYRWRDTVANPAPQSKLARLYGPIARFVRWLAAS